MKLPIKPNYCEKCCYCKKNDENYECVYTDSHCMSPKGYFLAEVCFNRSGECLFYKEELGRKHKVEAYTDETELDSCGIPYFLRMEET